MMGGASGKEGVWKGMRAHKSKKELRLSEGNLLGLLVLLGLLLNVADFLRKRLQCVLVSGILQLEV